MVQRESRDVNDPRLVQRVRLSLRVCLCVCLSLIKSQFFAYATHSRRLGQRSLALSSVDAVAL